ncbi:MAG: GNAT family N-acetyltransferase [Candidatus Acidiferrales bacterium]
MSSVSKNNSRDFAAGVRLRAYTPADFERLYVIDQSCYEPRIAYSRTELRQYLRFPGADCVVAETMQKHSAEAMPQNAAEDDARHNAASAMIGFCITAHKTSWGYIITMDVLSSYRRHGVGSMLLIEAERRLIASGVRQIGLETATNNSPAIAFWQKHGYRKSGIRKNYYPGGRDAYSMAKRLAGVQSVAKAGSQH